MAIDKTVLLNKQFKGKPTVIVHPGGYSLNESTKLESSIMKNTIFNSIEKLDVKNVNFLLENMPPYAWFFGREKVKNHTKGVLLFERI